MEFILGTDPASAIEIDLDNNGVPDAIEQYLDEMYALVDITAITDTDGDGLGTPCDPCPLDADDEELTRTRKVRRNFVIKRYQDLVDALYGDQEELNIEANIRYRDGSSYRMKTLVRIKQVESI